jgi:hypothetical protein
MSFVPRSRWEYGDRVAETIAAEEHADHARAGARGLRIRALSQSIVSGLVARNVLPGAQTDAARVIIFGILADALYGRQAIDIQNLRIERTDV